MDEPLDVMGIDAECRSILRDPIYSRELCAKLIKWLQVPNAVVTDRAGLCLIKLGPPAFDDLLAYVTGPGTIWPMALWPLSACRERWDQLVPLLRSWLANATGDLEIQCARSLGNILASQQEEGLTPAQADIDACRLVMEQAVKTSASVRVTLLRFHAVFGASGTG